MIKKILLVLVAILIGISGYYIGKDSNNTKTQEETIIDDESIDENYLSMYSYLLDLQDTVYCIGHKSPDTDTVVSAICMADLLNRIGVNAKACVSENISKESKVVLDYFDIETPEILSDATGKNLFLVDHNEIAQVIDGYENANIVGIIDHHNIDDVHSTNLVYSNIAPVGSTTMLIYSKYKELNIPVDEKIAGLMCAGLMSDTNNLNYVDSVTKMDETYFNELLEISKLNRDEFNIARLKGKVDYDGKTSKEILFSDYKEYEINGKNVGIGTISTVGQDDSLSRIEEMKQAIDDNFVDSKMDYFYLMIHDYVTNEQYILCKGEGAKQICEQALNIEFDDYLTLTESISRKATFVPALTEVIK